MYLKKCLLLVADFALLEAHTIHKINIYRKTNSKIKCQALGMIFIRWQSVRSQKQINRAIGVGLQRFVTIHTLPAIPATQAAL